MELYEIEAFLALADHLHFRRAAEQLRMSSGRVTQTIRQLERRVGARLFDRTTRRVALTAIGQQLLADLRPGYETVQRAMQRAIAAGRGFDGELTVGFLGAAAGQLAYAAGEGFRAAYPQTVLGIKEVRPSDGVDGWLGEDCDMVLAGRPIVDPTLTVGPVLITERRMLAISTRHRLAARRAIELEDLGEVRLLRVPQTWPASLIADRNPETTPSGRPIIHGERADTTEELLAMIGVGAGGCLVGDQTARFYQRPGVSYIPLLNAAPIESGFLWRTSRETAKIRAFNESALAISNSDSSRRRAV